jgi:hypothetical protein
MNPMLYPLGFIVAEYDKNQENDLVISSSTLHYWCNMKNNIDSNGFCFDKFNHTEYKDGYCIGYRKVDHFHYLGRYWPVYSFNFDLKLFFFVTLNETQPAKVKYSRKIIIELK